MKYTITEFRADYPNDDACLDKIFKLRYSNLICPKCDGDKPFNRVKGRRSYQCPCCGFQVYPTKGTIFEKSTTPLTYWFYIIYLLVTQKSGLAALKSKREFGFCYTTALRISHLTKKAVSDTTQTKEQTITHQMGQGNCIPLSYIVSYSLTQD